MSKTSKIKNIALILLTLAFFMPAEAQYIGLRTENGWAETPMLRKTFTLSKSDLKTGKILIDVNSLGYHEVYVNGHLASPVLQPAVSQLDKHSLKVTYNITAFLHKGSNEIMLWLGQGWGRVYNTPAAVHAEIYRAESDGYCSTEWTLVTTDSTWQASASPYSYTGSWQPLQFGGERYDARVKPVWGPATKLEVTNMQVKTQKIEGNRIVDTLYPHLIIHKYKADSSIIIDFGRVITGWFQADFDALPSGHEVNVEYFDDYELRSVYPIVVHNPESYSETDIYIADGNGNEYFTNRFHLHAFRYVRIKGVASFNARALQISALNPSEGATFECSDPRLNAIHDMIKHTLSCLTFSGYMVDCPHLERMGYGGDGNSSTMTLQTIYDVHDTYTNWLDSWLDAMDSNGSLPYVAPAFPTGGGPYWSGFIVKAPWRTYLNYGDTAIVYRLYDKLKRWLNYVDSYSPDGLLQPWPDEGRMWFLGDWLAPKGVDVGGASQLFVSNCFISECFADMELMARLINKQNDAHYFAERRRQLVEKIHQEFYNPENQTYANGTPLDLSYALLAGIPPDSSTRQAVKERLLTDCHEKYNDHIAVGLMGIPIFTEWAIRERQTELMATILRQPDYPGYLYMINHGATTTWESWDGKRSRVHNCYNGIGIWFYQALAGIRPDPEAPGYKHFFIDPQPCSGITWLHATKPTVYGTVIVDIKDGIMQLTVPQGTTATLFPGTSKERTVSAGKWTVNL